MSICDFQKARRVTPHTRPEEGISATPTEVRCKVQISLTSLDTTSRLSKGVQRSTRRRSSQVYVGEVSLQFNLCNICLLILHGKMPP